MRRSAALSMLCCAVLAACVTARRRLHRRRPWEQRVAELQKLDCLAARWPRRGGRRAPKAGRRRLNWRQRRRVGGSCICRAPSASAPWCSSSTAGRAFVQRRAAERCGACAVAGATGIRAADRSICGTGCWAFPIRARLSTLTRNDQDRAQQLIQAGWTHRRTIATCRCSGDVLPARLVLSRERVRVRIVVDHWELRP